jgi:chemotaxis protein methyltransferase WspC
MIDRGFAPIRLRMSFGFQKNGSRPAVTVPPPQAAKPEPDNLWPKFIRPKTAGESEDPGRESLRFRTSLPRAVEPALAPPAASSPSLETARAHADAGRLDEADATCRQFLKESGGSADAYTLLGVIQDARGDGGAEDSYRKAIYLDPRHQQALTHLAIILERRGDIAGAVRLKARARRTDA